MVLANLNRIESFASDLSHLMAHCDDVEEWVQKYLEEQPQVRHYTADALVYRVLTRVWPCKKGSGV